RKDTHGAWNPVTGQFRVPVAGDYLVTTELYISINGHDSIYVRKNNTNYATLGRFQVYPFAGGAAVVANCEVGDLLDIYVPSGYSTNDGDCSFVRLNNNYAQVGATETVAARAPISSTSLSGQTQLNLSTPVLDTHGAIQNNTFVVP